MTDRWWCSPRDGAAGISGKKFCPPWWRDQPTGAGTGVESFSVQLPEEVDFLIPFGDIVQGEG